MSKIVKHPEERRNELIETALKQFLAFGYEKTSIRSILKEVGGEIGMFYHYFESKQEIYEEALKLFNDEYIKQLKKDIGLAQGSFTEKVKMIFKSLELTLNSFQILKTTEVDPELLVVLHRNTLLTAVPIFEKFLVDQKNENSITIPDVNERFLAEFVLFGISAIIHDEKEKNFKVKTEQIILILDAFFNDKSNEKRSK